MEGEWLQAFGYRLDESDPDIIVLRRRDGTFVAAFSASGANQEGICRAAEEDLLAAPSEQARQGVGDV